MDAIADTTIVNAPSKATSLEDVPSIFAVILDTNPFFWTALRDKVDLKSIIQSTVVSINAHLASNNSNQVIVLAAHSTKAAFLFPDPSQSPDSGSRSESVLAKTDNSNSPTPEAENGKQYLSNSNIYRQFKVVDEAVFRGLENLFKETAPENSKPISTIPAAISKALTYINRLRQFNEGLVMNARLLVVGAGSDNSMSYISTMNSIFAAQTMKIPIDVCKLGEDSTYLQQAAEVSSGIYLKVDNPQGLIQYLATIFFVDPSIRDYVSLPVNNNIDFRASCFLTGSVVDIGYVCSVCLCVLSVVPEEGKCPTCDSVFDEIGLQKLKRGPAVKRRKKEQ